MLLQSHATVGRGYSLMVLFSIVLFCLLNWSPQQTRTLSWERGGSLLHQLKTILEVTLLTWQIYFEVFIQMLASKKSYLQRGIPSCQIEEAFSISLRGCLLWCKLSPPAQVCWWRSSNANFIIKSTERGRENQLTDWNPVYTSLWACTEQGCKIYLKRKTALLICKAALTSLGRKRSYLLREGGSPSPGKNLKSFSCSVGSPPPSCQFCSIKHHHLNPAFKLQPSKAGQQLTCKNLIQLLLHQTGCRWCCCKPSLSRLSKFPWQPAWPPLLQGAEICCQQGFSV